MASIGEGAVAVGGAVVGGGAGTPFDVLAPLLRAGRAASAEELLEVVADHARLLGFEGAWVWLVEHGQRRLVRASTPGPASAGPGSGVPESTPVDGSPPGDAFRTLAPVRAGDDLWLPLSAGTERLGVLQMRIGGAAVPPDLDAFALLVGELVLTRSLYSDIFFRLRRRETMSLEAELQWSLLPPLNSRCGGTSLAGVLEPAYEVGGDAFDHALNEGILHLAVFDAVGHDVGASIVSHVALGAYRHARRRGDGLRRTAAAVDAAVADHVGDSQFATGVLARLDCARGELQWLGVGHPTPLLLRAGAIIELTGPPSRPFGLGISGAEPELVELRAGDRVLLYTDGVIDERSWDDHADAVTWLGECLVEAASSGARPEEVVRQMMTTTVDRWQGHQRDDATLLLVEWSPS